MLSPLKTHLAESSNSSSFPPQEKITKSFVHFCEQMGEVFEVKKFLMILRAQIPKKVKIGELLLFYESKQLGLRRAYIRNKNFYEEEAKNPWPTVNTISLNDSQQSLYLASELGRPFSKTLMIPLGNNSALFETQKAPLLFIEMSEWKKHFEFLSLFFKERCFLLKLILERVLLNTHLNKISYLWSQVFSYWGEPLAIVQDFQILKSNLAFKELILHKPHFLKQKKLSGFMETEKKIYQLHYYPISQFKNIQKTGFLYCQDMTKHFHLKEKLFQSEKMTSLCELGKNMAHQLNNPLTGVRSMAQILYQNPRLENFKEDFLEIEEAVKRSQKIIESFLSFSNSQGEKISCDLNQVIKNTLLLLKKATQGIGIKIQFSKEPVETIGDFSILQQVAYNLILNACQALQEKKTTSKASIEITIKKTSENKAGLKIKDNGPGIPKKNLEKIFQPLWTSKKKGQGTGLGLGIARQFIKECKGELFVSSKENEFACFTVLLPLKNSKD